ncbi:AAA family ATPase [Methylomonas sp. CM2]|uniref:AAA family ATPase n=1 Tax=Methylomonas sp. CM2 TaxID=3417647 RepID=UPI003CECA873
MKINKLELINFRCFKEYELKLSDRFTLLIGDNGSGKTAILDSIAIATGSFLLGIPDLRPNEKRHISRDDVRYKTLTMGQTPVKETEYQTMVYSQGLINNIKTSWARYKDIKTNRQDAKKIISIVEKLINEVTNPKTLFPVIAYYGTGRLWKQLKATEKKTKGPTSRLDGFQDCLNPASDQKDFSFGSKLKS